MSNLSPLLLLTVVAGTAAPAVAALPPATANTVLIASSTLVAPVPVISPEFGSHQAVGAGGQARANLSVGTDGAAVPFIAFNAAASGPSWADVTGSLAYHWVVQGAPGSSELVPVTITSLGNIRGQVTAQSLRPDARAGVSANWLSMGISNTFTTGGDERTYGLETGNVNFGATNVVFTDPALSAPGGSVTATGAASFSETFTLMVYPNATNQITMRVRGAVVGFSSNDHYAYSWAMNGYLDPVITIDPAYASRFSVLQSDIPMVPVPEASTLAMMLAGLVSLLLFARRRSAAGKR